MAQQVTDALIPVAQYVRMSTDDQKYSPHNQSAANDAYLSLKASCLAHAQVTNGAKW
jgi:hypothetical protein